MNAIFLNIKINLPKLVITCGYKLSNKLTKFHRNTLSHSENTAKSFFLGGGYFLTYTVCC